MSKVKIDNNTFFPMPVALLGTVVEGRPNFMAVGFLSRVNASPPYLAMGINQRHHTTAGIQANRAFSVNFPGTGMVVKTDYCGIVSGRRADKGALFELFEGELRGAPMIAECPVCLECSLVAIHEMPSNNLVVGEIVGAYTDEKYLTEGEIDFRKTDPLLLTMRDNTYWGLGEAVGKAWSDGKKMKA